MPAQILATATGCTMKSSPERRRWSAWRSQANTNARSIGSRSSRGHTFFIPKPRKAASTGVVQWVVLAMCDHSGYFSGTTRYDHEKRLIRYVVTCDDCGGIMREINSEPYLPKFDPHGNDEYLGQLGPEQSAA